MVEQPMPIEGAGGALAASTRLLTLSQGIYRFSVAPESPTGVDKSEHLTLPAVYIALAPDTPAKAANLLPGPSTTGTWLCEAGNLVFAGVSDSAATFLMTSIPATGGEELTIEMERVDDVAAPDGISADPMSPRKRAAPQAIEAAVPRSTPVSEPSRRALRLQIVAHLRNRGDMTFIDVPWAGRVGNGLWVEAFAVRPLEGLTPADIEYRAVTASGFETPWVSGGESCGTRGKADPLVAFAARLRPSLAEPRYELEYSGYFRSGSLVGPVKNGAPCRSTLQGDPLEGVQIRIVERNAATSDSLAVRSSPAAGSKPPADAAPAISLIPAAPAKRLRFTKIPLPTIVAYRAREVANAKSLVASLPVAATRKPSPLSRRPTADRPMQRKPPEPATRAVSAKKRTLGTIRASKAAAPGNREDRKVKSSPRSAAKAPAAARGAKKLPPISTKPVRKKGLAKSSPAKAVPRKASKTRSAAKTSRRAGRARHSRGR